MGIGRLYNRTLFCVKKITIRKTGYNTAEKELHQVFSSFSAVLVSKSTSKFTLFYLETVEMLM
jgi:hypothetical protein